MILRDGVRPGGALVLHGDGIAAVAGEPRRTVTENLGGCAIAPGLIDAHTHGITGADTWDADLASLVHRARRFAAHGVNAFLASTITEGLDLTVAAIRAVRVYAAVQALERPAGARVLGRHLEGPWLAATYKRHSMLATSSRPRLRPSAASRTRERRCAAPLPFRANNGADHLARSRVCFPGEQGSRLHG